ncbi:hypothetical protein [Moorena sp. SIO3I6]|nr:hypothetical protein [Moorena sp. SIO3I6]
MATNPMASTGIPLMHCPPYMNLTPHTLPPTPYSLLPAPINPMFTAQL